MVETATADIEGLPAFNASGFLTTEDEPESVSRTLEYAYDHWAVARMAEALGQDSLATRFDALALGYRNVLDARGFARPRRNGGWLTPFEPREVNNHYTEANSWQYSFFVPHDLAGWIETLGGVRAMEAHLDALFEAPEATTGRDQADITGPHRAVRAWQRAQPRLRLPLRRLWRGVENPAACPPDPGRPLPAHARRLPGNEDCGQMSAWFVFSAMGFYPVTPGTTTYALGTPLFETVRLLLPSGGTFTITGYPASGPYVQRVTLNGD